MEREHSVAAAMLGLPGFVVFAVSDYAGELEQAMTAPDVGAGSAAESVRMGRRSRWWPASSASVAHRDDHPEISALLAAGTDPCQT